MNTKAVIPEGDSVIWIGRFRLRSLGDGKYWISSIDGEGMETSEVKLEKIIAEFFKREF